MDLEYLFAREPLSNLWSHMLHPSRVFNQQFFEGQTPVVFFGLKYSCESKELTTKIRGRYSQNLALAIRVNSVILVGPFQNEMF